MSEQAGEAVWDGQAWVHPATGQVWDGTRWHVPAPAAPPPPPPPQAAVTAPAASSAPVPVVGRGVVFGHVLWRVIVVCVAGGAVIGTLVILAFLAFPDEAGEGEAWSFVIVGPIFGAILGVLLAVVAAPLIAGVCAASLVPYPGAARARLVARALGVGLVALFIPFLFLGAVPEVGVLVVIGAIWLAAVAGAWFLSPWVVRWYVRRMEAAPAGAPPPPATTAEAF